ISRHLRGAHHGVQVVIVRAATAKVARQGMTGLLSGRPRVGLQKRDRRHYLTWRAEAALRSELVDHRLLHGVELAVWALDPLDGRHLAGTNAVGQDRAGVRGHVVDQHRARTALAAIASELRPGES